MKSLFVSLFLCISLVSFSQSPLLLEPFQAEYKYLFDLSDSIAEELYLGKVVVPLDEQWYGAKVDSVKIDSFFLMSEYPPGNYVEIKVEGVMTKHKVVSHFPGSIYWLHDRQKTFLHLTDADGDELKEADVFFHGKRLERNPETQLYSLKKKDNLERYLKIHWEGRYFYWTIDQNHYWDESYERSLFLRKTGYLAKKVLLPRIGYWVRKLAYNPMKEMGNRSYIALNQPKFRHGDTLKWKAFILDKNGKPLAEELSLNIAYENSYWETSVLKQSISPEFPGVYRGEVVLSDTLQVDRLYTLSLEQDWANTISQSFRLEDYELEEYQFSLDVDKTALHRNDSLHITLKATDANGLPAAGTSVELKFLHNSTHSVFDKELYLPKELWDSTLTLDDRGEKELTLPVAGFPRANFSLDVVATFTSLSNEVAEKEALVNFNSQEQWLEAYTEGDSLKVYWRPDTPAELRSQSVFVNKKPVQLPYHHHIGQYEYSFIITSGSLRREVYSSSFDGPVGHNVHFSGDTAHVAFLNPQGYKVLLSLYEGKSLRMQRWTTSGFDTLLINPKKPHFLSYSYPFQSEPRYQTVPIQLPKTVAHIEIDLPEKIYPGQKVEGKVRVTDYLNNPIPDMEMTVLGHTSKFQESSHSGVPSFEKTATFKANPPWSVSAMKDIERSRLYSKSLDQPHHDLSNRISYTLLNADTLTKHYEPIEGGWSQVCPMIVEDGLMLEPHMIYVNDKLVHTSFSSTPNFTINCLPDTLSIRIRTRSAEYHFPKMVAQPGKRLLVAMNAQVLPLGGLKFDRETKLSDYEKRMLKRQLMYIHRQGRIPRYVQQRDQVLRIDHRAQQDVSSKAGYYYSSNFVIGPLRPNYYLPIVGYFDQTPPRKIPLKTSEFWVFHDTHTDLIPIEHFEFLDVSLRKYRSREDEVFFRAGLTPHDLTDFYHDPGAWAHYGDLFHTTNEGNGTYYGYDKHASDGPQGIEYLMLVPLNDSLKTRVLSVDELPFHNVIPGVYDIMAISREGSFTKIPKVEIKANTELHQSWEGIELDQKISEKEKALFVKRDYKTMRSLFGEDIRYQNYDQSPFDPQLKKSYYLKFLDSETGTPIPGVYCRSAKGKQLSDDQGILRIDSRANALQAQFYHPGWGMIWHKYEGDSCLLVKMKPIPDTTMSLPTYMLELNKAPGDSAFFGYTIQEQSVERAMVHSMVSHEVMSKKGSSVAVLRSIRKNKLRATGLMAASPEEAWADDEVLYLMESPGNVSTVAGLAYHEEEGFDEYGYASAAVLESEKMLVMDSTSFNGTFAWMAASSGLRTIFADCALWESHLVTDKNGEVSFSVTFPEDITGWKVYALGMDQGQHSGLGYTLVQSYKPLMAKLYTPRFLLVGDEAQAIGTIENKLGEPAVINTRFFGGDAVQSRDNFEVKSVQKDYFDLPIPKDTDSLTVSYQLDFGGEFTDGEERPIPVYRQGTLETEGEFFILDGDANVVINPGSHPGGTTLRLEKNGIDLMLRELKHLQKYPYSCNEQRASKLQAFLMEQRICEVLDQEFKGERDIRRLIRLLKKDELDQGGWGWWPKSPYNPFMTMVVAEALIKADSMEYNAPELTAAMNGIQQALPRMQPNTLARSLLLLQQLHMVEDEGYWANELDKKIRVQELEVDSYPAMAATLFKLRAGIPVDLTPILNQARYTLYGNMYWGKEPGFWLFTNNIDKTLLAYQIFKLDTANAHVPGKIQGYLLERKQPKGWRNTLESASILSTLLPDMLATPSDTNVQVKLGNQTITTFPYEHQFHSNENVFPMQVNKTGGFPVYMSYYQQWWEEKPTPKAEPFHITTQFLKNGKALTDALEVGETIVLKATLKTDKASDYVMFEVPIPAACSYGKGSEEKTHLEAQRERFREKTNIYCEHLAPGTYEFDIPLIVKYPGKFTQNPAAARHMYFPVFQGRNELKKVVVEAD